MDRSLSGVPRRTTTVVGLISGSQFVNHAYLVLFPPILGILSGEFDVGLTALGIALGVQGATNTLFQLPFGWLADARDRTVAFALSSVLGALGVLVVALAPSFPILLLGQALIGVGVAGHHPAHYPLLSDATPEDLRGRAYSVYGFGGSLGFATPPAVITLVTGVGLSWRYAVGGIGVVGLLYAVVGTVVLSQFVGSDVTAPNVTAASDGGGPAGEKTGLDGVGTLATRLSALAGRARRELAALTDSPGILGLSLFALLSSTASWGVTSYAVVFLTSDTYGVGLDTANLTLTGMFAVGAAAILIGGVLTDRTGPAPVIVGSYAVVTGLLVTLGVGVLPGLAAVIAMLAVGGTRSLAGPARDGLTDLLSADDAVGTNFAVVSVGVMLGNAVAPPAFGYLIDTSGARAAFLVVAAVSAVATVVSVWLVVRVLD
jgi:MFS family permease